ncbi:MAG: SCO1664 family protein [Chloroflexi bacterium]|nr:SCO1664 family protein [Chloroflexota bacterium]
MGTDQSPSSRDEVKQALLRGEIASPRLIPQGSNHTFLVTVHDGSRTLKAVYKPSRGERPLWDFPSGTLHKREHASYLVTQALRWDFIPLTVIRDGPFGTGSLQLWVDADPQSNYFTLREERLGELERIALFDCLSNNADRKASHCFRDRDGNIWSIDHGLTFHTDPKLRTVIWDFAQEPISTGLMEDVAALLSTLRSPTALAQELSHLLTPEEMDALRRRLQHLLASGRFPDYDPSRRNVPWPWF